MAGKSIDVGGVRFDAEAEVGGKPTVLNGCGLRKILMFNAYAIGLYLAQKQKTNEDIFADPGAKRLRLVLLKSLTASQLADVIESGIAKNISEEEFEALAPRVKTVHAAILDAGSAASGSALNIDWVPGKGKAKGATRMALDDKPVGKDIPGEDFFVAILKVWLGDNVNDTRLRDALRGKV
jgi:hypothetical protein